MKKFDYILFNTNKFYLFAVSLDSLYGDLYFLNKNDDNFKKTKDKIWKNLKNEIKLNLLYGYESDEIEAVMKQLDSIKKKFEEQSSKIPNRCKDKTNKYLNIFVFNSLDWWKEWEYGPLLANYSRMYLTWPATSCSSEKAFKSTGFIYNEERSRLHTNTIEKLVFIRENMHILPSEISILSQLVK